MNSVLLKVQLAILLGFSVLVAGEWGYGLYDFQQLKQRLSAEQVAESTIETLPELAVTDLNTDQFSELVERPLFIEGRKPVQVKTQANEQQLDTGQLDEWELVGIYSKDRGQHYRAIWVKPNDKKKKEVLEVNQSIAGWRIAAIENDRVTVQQNGQSKTLFLYKPRKFAGGQPPHLPQSQEYPHALPSGARTGLQAMPPPVAVPPVQNPMNTEMINDAVSDTQ